MYFESHAHYDDPRFNMDRDLLLSEGLPYFGIDYIVNVGADIKSSIASIKLANKYNYVYATVGVHPHAVKNMKDSDFDLLEKWVKENEKVVAIGEIGLDFHYDNSPRELQIKRFKQQLELANKVDLPVVIHSREADQLVFDIIKEADINEKGIIHCYSGSAELAYEYIKLGFYIGIGGVITYKNAKKLIKTVENTEISKIVLETDCPYLSPDPNRGNRNSSYNLEYICRKIGQIKHILPEKVAEITKENAIEIYGIN